MNRTSALTDLPNEIFLKIFYQLSPVEVLRGWWNINARLNHLILSASYQVALKGRHVTDAELRAIKILRHQVVSLVVTKKWCRLLYEFNRIQKLHVIGFTHPFSLAEIRPNSYPNLINIKFDLSELDWDNFMEAEDYHYAKQIVKCQCYKLLRVPTVSCHTLRSVKVILCESKALAALLSVAPALHHVAIRLYTRIDLNLYDFNVIGISTTDSTNEHPSFTPTTAHEFEGQYYPNLRKLEISFECETTLKWFDIFLSCTPNLTHLSLEIARTYEVLSFIELHRILQMRLPALKQNNFHFRYCCLPKSFDLEQHRNIGPLFATMTAHEFQSGPMTLLSVSVNWTRPLS